MIIGYTAGVFDLFHIGHLNLLRNAKSVCDKLIVGVSTDELVAYKHKSPVICYEERSEIVRSIRYVDAVMPQENMDKLAICKKISADILIVGDDWYETDKWADHEKEFATTGVKIVYFPYTKNTSSTLINEVLNKKRAEINGNITN